MDAFFEYEDTWKTLNEYVERFNDRFKYHFYIESFLQSDDFSNVGIFNQFGLMIFFLITPHLLEKNKIVTNEIDLLRIQVNPEDLISYEEFEVVAVNYSSRLLRKRMEEKRNGNK